MTSQSTSPLIAPRPPLTLWDKTLALGSLVAAGAIFLTIGWMTVEPDDPHGAVSLLTHDNAMLMVLQATGLSAVTAAIATIVAGRKLPDVGTLAVAVGLAAVSLRGETTGSLLVRQADLEAGFQRALALKFALESVAWFAVIFVGLITSAAVMRWLFTPPASTGGTGPSDAESGAWVLSGYDLPFLGDRVLRAPIGRYTTPKQGLIHTVVATGSALVVMAVLSAGLSSRGIEHGQACFLVAASVCIATRIAYRVAPVQTPLWSILAVGLFAALGYIWSGIGALPPGLPAHLPQSAFLRVLPVQYVAVGTAAGLAMLWYIQASSARITERQASRQAARGKTGARS
jgi:hypothetical protein